MRHITRISALLLLATIAGCDDPAPPEDGIEISLTVLGNELDSNGVDLLIDDASLGAVTAESPRFVTRLSDGMHEIRIAGVSERCVVAEQNPRWIEGPVAGRASIHFTLMCGRQALVTTPEGDFLVSLTTEDRAELLPERPVDLDPATDVSGSFTLETATSPRWSNSGTLAFVGLAVGASGSWLVIRAHDGAAVAIDTIAAPRHWTPPAWSPDGATIALQTADARDLWYGGWTHRTADGPAATPIESSARGVSAADWHPTEPRLVYTADRAGSGGPAPAYSMPPYICFAHQVPPLDPVPPAPDTPTGEPPAECLDVLGTTPVWSPDGGRIAFVDTAAAAPAGIYSILADGSGRQPELVSDDELRIIDWTAADGLIYVATSAAGGTVYALQPGDIPSVVTEPDLDVLDASIRN